MSVGRIMIVTCQWIISASGDQ